MIANRPVTLLNEILLPRKKIQKLFCGSHLLSLEDNFDLISSFEFGNDILNVYKGRCPIIGDVLFGVEDDDIIYDVYFIFEDRKIRCQRIQDYTSCVWRPPNEPIPTILSNEISFGIELYTYASRTSSKNRYLLPDSERDIDIGIKWGSLPSEVIKAGFGVDHVSQFLPLSPRRKRLKVYNSGIFI